MSLSCLSEDISLAVSEVTAAIESVQIHNMGKLLSDLERRKVQVDFGELSEKTQRVVREMIEKKHWCINALRNIIMDIPECS